MPWPVPSAANASACGSRRSQPSTISATTHRRTRFDYVVAQLNPRRLAFLDILQGTGGAPREQWEPFDYDRLRDLFEGNLILNNGYDFASAQVAIGAGKADAIAFGRMLLANPDLVERFRQGAPLNQPDYDKLYSGEEKGYTDYPTLAG